MPHGQLHILTKYWYRNRRIPAARTSYRRGRGPADLNLTMVLNPVNHCLNQPFRTSTTFEVYDKAPCSLKGMSIQRSMSSRLPEAPQKISNQHTLFAFLLQFEDRYPGIFRSKAQVSLVVCIILAGSNAWFSFFLFR